MRGGILFTLLALVSLSLAPGDAGARPAIRSAFFAAYPAALGSRLDNLPSISGHCGVCHYQFTGAGPRNRYGQWVEAALPGYPNTSDGKRLAILSVQNNDSDADGCTNLAEITDLVTYVNTPTFPGLVPANVDSVSAVNKSDLLAYLVPATGTDTTPPTITVLTPNGGESWTGEGSRTIAWSASDNAAVTSVDLFYRDADISPWEPIALNLPNTGTYSWFVLNTPATSARVRAVAHDAAGNTGSDMTDGFFTIVRMPGGIAPTTLRDFKQSGSQPLEGGLYVDHTACTTCHGGYNIGVEPGYNWQGSMMAQAGRDPLFFACLAVANQDAPSSGDLCLRCHNSFGWLGGKSTPTSGVQMTTALDRDGVSCDFCHRVVDPIYKAGVSPVEDQAILTAMLPSHVPTTYANGQYVVDSISQKRGPFADAAAPHTFLTSAVHTKSDFCGTCHDVSNPVFGRVSGADYAPGPLDQTPGPVTSDAFMPLERTYSEWKNSAFVAGVYAPDFAGSKPGGIVSTCQDCHMRAVAGTGCNDPLAPLRADLPLHDMTGGNAWLPSIIATLNPLEVSAASTTAASSRSVSMLQRAAAMDLAYTIVGDSFQAVITVTNRTGHKLPTGYPEGRRMWLHVVARDGGGAIVYESGAYDPATGVLTRGAGAAVYEAELGISPALAGALGVPHGPSFHFALNDSLYKDNRIPPQGFTNAAFAAFGGTPVDPDRPALVPRYADGQNADTQKFGLPSTARSVSVELLYQTTSKEYVEFLRDQNTTNTAGQTMYNVWTGNGRSWPVVMQTDSVGLNITGVPEQPSAMAPALRVLRNPFGSALELRVDLARPTSVRLDVFNVQGRKIRTVDWGVLAAGTHPLAWDGRLERGTTAGAGIYWISVRAGEHKFVRQVVRVK
ncbi:MAG TPA: FlgD immunoglobulin-like domain containing protein [Candidatus Omnitrophota bacterium]|nr:FlgD immunoglobulin-like domain containing protein [Candidatus Omnitrophota bacterium]